MRVEWVHPSWRDLVISHLAEDAEARERFVSSCGAHGALLALSTAGGERGERKLPLLVRDSDWDALTDRLYELAPELDTPELVALLDSVRVASRDVPAATAEAMALAGTVLGRVSGLWDEADAPIPLPALEAWLALAGRLNEDSAKPAPTSLQRTWAELLPASAPSLGDRESVERFADWLTFADLLREHSPNDLHRFRFGDQARIINTFLDEVDSAHGRFPTSASDHVQRALNRIETLVDELGNLSLYIWNRVRAAQAGFVTEWRPPRAGPPLPGEGPGWRLFDVARVLDDL